MNMQYKLIGLMLIGYLLSVSQSCAWASESTLTKIFSFGRANSGSTAVSGDKSQAESSHSSAANLLSSGQGSTEVSSLNRLNKPKNNKFSKILHFAYDKTGDLVYKPSDESKNVALVSAGNSEAVASDATPVTTAPKEPDWSSMKDDQVIEAACELSPHKSWCKQAVKIALKKPSGVRARIATAIRSKPPHVPASRVLYHSLFGATVEDIESKGYDEKLNSIINITASKSPYGAVAVRALDMFL